LIYNENYKTKKLKVLDLQDGKDFKREVKLDLEYSDKYSITKKIILNLYKQVDMLESQHRSGNKLELNSEVLPKEHLSFINIDNIFFALQEFKNEKGWSNINIKKEAISKLLYSNNWYLLYMPKSDFNINSFKDFIRFETIMITLLKKYMKSFYEYKKSEWDSQFLEYRILDENHKKDKANLIKNYIVTVEDKETELIEKLKRLQSELTDKRILTFDRADFKVFNFDKHLYNPLIFKNKGEKSLKVTPTHLNDGEKDFIDDLSNYLNQEIEKYKNIEIFLLRNQSKSGIGFFEDGGFYPDFIMWVIKGDKQYINFIDPKGIRNLNPKNDPKLNFSIKIKEIEKLLKNGDIILNSFIISNTTLSSLNKLHSDLTYNFFAEKNVIFQKDNKNNYIQKMFNEIL
jgi:hypothetical protein